MSRIDESKDFIPVRIAVLTVSDTRSLAEDRSGDTLVQRLTDAGHVLAAQGGDARSGDGSPSQPAVRHRSPWVGGARLGRPTA